MGIPISYGISFFYFFLSLLPIVIIRIFMYNKYNENNMKGSLL